MWNTYWRATLLVSLLPAVGLAQEPAASGVIVTVDNDLLAARGGAAPPDYDYTHGASVTVARARAPSTLARAARQAARCRSATDRQQGCLMSTLGVGQVIYTPRQDAPVPIAGERPYGGWLFAEASARALATGRARTLAVRVGVTGPASLAEHVQNGVHRWLGNERQLGWAYQVPTSLGVSLRYDEVRRSDRPLGRRSAGSLALGWDATVGNLQTSTGARLEATLDLGRALSWDVSDPEAPVPRRLMARAGLRQELALHNVFVEGRGASGSAKRELFVREATVALGYRQRRWALEYRYTVRTREYAAQPTPHAYGSLTAVVLR